MNISEVSMELLAGGQSTQITLSAASAQGPVVARPTNHPAGVPIKCTLLPSVACWVRKGTNPTALADGTDQALTAGVIHRVELMEGERIAAIAGGAGTLNFTPGA